MCSFPVYVCECACGEVCVCVCISACMCVCLYVCVCVCACFNIAYLITRVDDEPLYWRQVYD